MGGSMNSRAVMDAAKQRAESTIKQTWRDVAASYTVGWMLPIQEVERQYPHIIQSVSPIRNRVPAHLPSVLYQSRETPPKDMVVAIPYAGGGGYQCRIAATQTLLPSEQQLLGGFAQALWFLIDVKVLPGPAQRQALEQKLVAWTSPTLINV